MQYDANPHENVFRIGQVSKVNWKKMAARVAFDERDDMVSTWLQVVSRFTDEQKDFYNVNVGEHVLCCFIPSGTYEGFIVGSYYTGSNLPKCPREHMVRTIYRDGAKFLHDNDDNIHLFIDKFGNFMQFDEEGIFIKDKNGSSIELTGGNIYITSANVIHENLPGRVCKEAWNECR